MTRIFAPKDAKGEVTRFAHDARGAKCAARIGTRGASYICTGLGDPANIIFLRILGKVTETVSVRIENFEGECVCLCVLNLVFHGTNSPAKQQREIAQNIDRLGRSHEWSMNTQSFQSSVDAAALQQDCTPTGNHTGNTMLFESTIKKRLLGLFSHKYLSLPLSNVNL